VGQCFISLGCKPFPLKLQDLRAILASQLAGGIAATGINDQDLIAKGQTAEALDDMRLLIESEDDRGNGKL